MISKLICPKCGYRGRVMIIYLASNPPQPECECGHCGFSMRYYHRKHRSAEITQDEINNYWEDGKL